MLDTLAFYLPNCGSGRIAHIRPKFRLGIARTTTIISSKGVTCYEVAGVSPVAIERRRRVMRAGNAQVEAV